MGWAKEKREKDRKGQKVPLRPFMNFDDFPNFRIGKERTKKRGKIIERRGVLPK